MALNFPSNPSLGQVYDAEGLTFIWNGAVWIVVSPSGYVNSNVSGIAGASIIANIVTLSQAAYDAIATPDPATLYIVVA